MPKCDFNKVTLNITPRHECFPANLLHSSEHLFIRTPMEGCFRLLQLTV